MEEIMKRLKIVSKTNMSKDQINVLKQKTLFEQYYDNVKEMSVNQTIKRIDDSEIVILNVFTPVNIKVLESCNHLKYIISGSSGINHIDLNACKSKNVKIKWFPNYCSRTVAEKTFAYILIAMNNIIPAMKNYEQGKWDYLLFKGRELTGKTICILGCGATGSLVKEYSLAFGMNVHCVNSKTPIIEIHEMLKQSDIISLNMSLNDKTINYINDEKIKLLKDDVIIVNTSRGNLIEEDSLYRFLSSNKKAIAFLDVLNNEPPELDHPFRKLPNVYITPHIGWNSLESENILSEGIFNAAIAAINEMDNEFS